MNNDDVVLSAFIMKGRHPTVKLIAQLLLGLLLMPVAAESIFEWSRPDSGTIHVRVGSPWQASVQDLKGSRKFTISFNSTDAYVQQVFGALNAGSKKLLTANISLGQVLFLVGETGGSTSSKSQLLVFSEAGSAWSPDLRSVSVDQGADHIFLRRWDYISWRMVSPWHSINIKEYVAASVLRTDHTEPIVSSQKPNHLFTSHIGIQVNGKLDWVPTFSTTAPEAVFVETDALLSRIMGQSVEDIYSLDEKEVRLWRGDE